MFILDNNMFGVIVEKNYLSNFKEEDRKFIDSYLILEKDENNWVCPQHLPIIKYLEDVKEQFE